MTKPVRVDNCPLCQPRYSRSPDRLGMRPIIPPSSASNNGGHPPTSNNSKKHQLQPKHSYGDLLASRRPPTLQRMEKKSRGRRSHSEFRPPTAASSSSTTTVSSAQTQVSAVNNGQTTHPPSFLARLNDENVNPLNLHPHHGLHGGHGHGGGGHRKNSRDLNGNNCKDNSDYAELSSSHNEMRIRKASRVSRSKSRVKTTNGGLNHQQSSGLHTVWPGKAGIWLPQ